MQQAISTQSIMSGFADSTGLSDTSREPRRYLWTDAFAVCNYLELYRQTGEQSFLQLGHPLLWACCLFPASPVSPAHGACCSGRIHRESASG